MANSFEKREDEDEDIAMRVHVDCYAGYRGEETPRRLRLKDRSVAVVEVLDRWLGPDHRYFKVRGEDRATYIIRYDEREDVWELTLYQEEARGQGQGWHSGPRGQG